MTDSPWRTTTSCGHILLSLQGFLRSNIFPVKLSRAVFFPPVSRSKPTNFTRCCTRERRRNVCFRTGSRPRPSINHLLFVTKSLKSTSESISLQEGDVCPQHPASGKPGKYLRGVSGLHRRHRHQGRNTRSQLSHQIPKAGVHVGDTSEDRSFPGLRSH